MLKPMSIDDLAAFLAAELPHSKAPIDFYGNFDESNVSKKSNGFRAVWTEIASAEIILITAMEGGSVTSIDVTPSSTGAKINDVELANDIQDFLEDNNLKTAWVEMNDKVTIFMKDGTIEKIFATSNMGLEIINGDEDTHYHDQKMESCLDNLDSGLVELY